MQFKPITPHMGAEVFGFDPATAGENEWQAVMEAFTERSVLVFRGVSLTPDQQVAVTRRFGQPYRLPYVTHLESHPDIIAVLKEADERRISAFGSSWHSDFSFMEQPPTATLLYALELPPTGGDTVFANQYLAYEALSPTYRKILEGLRSVQTGWPHGTKIKIAKEVQSRSVKMERGNPEADRETLHPIVRRHAKSGRPALFVNPVYTQGIEGMTEAESAPILKFLYEHAVRPSFCCRVRWEPGTLTLWDNSAVLHLAIDDYDGHRRLLHRTTVIGEVPEAA